MSNKSKTGWITLKDGRHIKLKIRASKRDYARLSSIINTNFTKWNVGLNQQIVGKKVYYFKYRQFDDFDVLGYKNYE